MGVHPFLEKKDTGLVIDEPDEISAITTQFMDDVKVHMTLQVYPYIDDAIGVYTPPDDDGGWNWEWLTGFINTEIKQPCRLGIWPVVLQAQLRIR